MTNEPSGYQEPRLVYAREGQIPELEARIERLTAENERLLAAGLGLVQHENGGRCVEQGGVPCRDEPRCGCLAEFEDWLLNQQQMARESAMQELADQAQELKMGYE